MGCDIHEFVEIKVNGQWVYAGKIIIYRDYALFGVLAGVRDHDIDPVAEAKGIPSDMSKGLIFILGRGKFNTVEEIEQNIQYDDYHSHSYLSMEEIYDAQEIYQEYLKGEDCSGIPEQLIKLGELKQHPFVEDVRFVFWFDN